MIFDVASICWEAHILMSILAALVETRDKYNIIIFKCREKIGESVL